MPFINQDPILILFGLFCIVIGASVLIRPSEWKEFLSVYRLGSPVAMLITGCLDVVFGLMIVLFFSSWGTPAHGLLTVVGYMALIEGAIFLFFPNMMQKFVSSAFYEGFFKFGGPLSILIGLLFLFL